MSQESPDASSPVVLSLSQQACMERAIQHLGQKDITHFQGSQKTFLPLRKWPGVTLSETGDVTEINWDNLFEEEGSISFGWIPPTVKNLSVKSCSLVGPLSFGQLPYGLHSLNLRGNHLSGVIHLRGAPRENLVEIDLGQNKLHGSLDMTHLPKRLKKLFLDGNRFGGGLDLTQLPEDLETLDLSRNKFHSDISIGNIPENLEKVDLTGNHVHEAEILENCSYEKSFILVENGVNLLKDTSERVLAQW